MSDQITSKVAGIFTIALGLGEMVGPSLGRALYSWIGYKWTLTTLSGVTILLGLAFLFCGGVRRIKFSDDDKGE